MGRVALLVGAFVVGCVGPVAAQSRSYVPEAPPQIKYMSARCSALNEALRNSGVRGLGYDTVSRLNKEYRDQCWEEENNARQKLQQDLRDKSSQRRETELGEARQKERTAVQREQCAESRRILQSKRARTDLNEGEKADLQRFEANFRARCA